MVAVIMKRMGLVAIFPAAVFAACSGIDRWGRGLDRWGCGSCGLIFCLLSVGVVGVIVVLVCRLLVGRGD